MADVVKWMLEHGEEGRNWLPTPNYENLLEAAGLTVVTSEYFGSYQGDAIAIVKDEQGREGISVWGYGSCSGCDHLQSIEPLGAYSKKDQLAADWSEMNAYADEMRQNVRWAESDGVAGLARQLLSERSEWYTFENEMSDYLKKIAGEE